MKKIFSSHFQMTIAAGYGGIAPSVQAKNTDHHLNNNPDILTQLGATKMVEDDSQRLALLNSSTSKGLKRSFVRSPSPPVLPKRSTSYDMPKLSPPTPFADDSFVAEALPHIIMSSHSKTLPRRPSQMNNARGGRKSLTSDLAIPPPPQYKGVHFAPEADTVRRSSLENAQFNIPVEGLPTKPAIPKVRKINTIRRIRCQDAKFFRRRRWPFKYGVTQCLYFRLVLLQGPPW